MERSVQTTMCAGCSFRSVRSPFSVQATSLLPTAFAAGTRRARSPPAAPSSSKSTPHPQTGRLIASIAQQVHKEQDRRNTILPLSVLGYVHNENPRDLSVGQDLVQASLIMAVGFTGSFRAGMALDELCRARERPIPVFAEMGSCNPVYVTARAGRKRGREIADQLADSILSRHGQQCTKPGLIFVEELTIDGKALRDRLIERFSSAAGRDMLAPWIRDSYQTRVAECARAPGVARLALGATGSSDRSAPAVLLATEYEVWRKNRMLQDEIFGPATILVDKVAGQMGANRQHGGPPRLFVVPRARGLRSRLSPSLPMTDSRPSAPGASWSTVSPPASTSPPAWFTAARSPQRTAPTRLPSARSPSSAGAGPCVSRTARRNSCRQNCGTLNRSEPAVE